MLLTPTVRTRIDDSHRIFARTHLLWDDAARIRREMLSVLEASAHTLRCSSYLAPRRICGGAPDDLVPPEVNEASQRPGEPAVPTTTRILRFLHEHSGKLFCARCISVRLFDGRNIDVAMRHVEARGVRRHHAQCEGCGKPRLVAGLAAS